MTDLITLMGKLVDNKGKILIPGVYDTVPEVTTAERYVVCCIRLLVVPIIRALRALYEALDYSIKDIEDSVGASIALSDDKVEVLMGRMRNPCLSLHGIEGAFSGVGATAGGGGGLGGNWVARGWYFSLEERVDDFKINFKNKI